MSEQKPNTDNQYYLFALRIIGDFGASIAIPIVFFTYLGQYADNKFSTEPYFLIGGFVISAISSGHIIFKKAKTYGRQYEQLNKKNRS